MIAGLVAAFAFVQASVVEIVAPAEPNVVIQALVKLPTLGERELARATVATKTWLEGTTGYTRARLWSEASEAGVPPSVTLMPDHIRFQLTVPRGRLQSGADLMISLLREPSIPQPAVDSALASLPFRRPGLWEVALHPWKARFDGIDRRQVADFIARTVRPENVTVGVGGPVEPGAGERGFTDLWKGYRPPPASLALAEPRTQLGQVHGRAGILELKSAPYSARLSDLPTRLLTLVALGVGKEGAMYRTLREDRALSYLQQAILWPHPDGFESRLLVAHEEVQGESATPEMLREILLKDVEGWGEVHRQRALAMAESAFLRGSPWHVFAFAPGGFLNESFADQVFLETYWRLKTGRAYDAPALLRSMGHVTLRDLKESATTLLQEAVARSVKAQR